MPFKVLVSDVNLHPYTAAGVTVESASVAAALSPATTSPPPPPPDVGGDPSPLEGIVSSSGATNENVGVMFVALIMGTVAVLFRI